MMVAHGVRRDGSRQLPAFQRSLRESQAVWEGLLEDLYRRGLEGTHLALIVTDGCPGVAAAIQVVYPRVAHQRCWVHKMRNILEKVRKRDYDPVKADARAIYLARDRAAARDAFDQFRQRWRSDYPTVVKQLERDLPELQSFFSFPKHPWRQLRTTNLIERVFVEVRRRTPRWSASSTWLGWIGSSTRSFTGLIWTRATAPSGFLHKPLAITYLR